MVRGRLLTVLALALLAVVSGCAPVTVEPSSSPAPSGSATPTPSTAPAIDPQQGFPGACEDLVKATELEAATGGDLPSRGYDITSSIDGIPARAGGLLSCYWSTNPGYPRGSELRVTVLPFADEAYVTDWASSSFQSCYHSEIAAGSTSCNRTGWANGYWMEVMLTTVPGAGEAESADSMDRLSESIKAALSAAPRVNEPSDIPIASLSTSLCDRGATTMATLHGVDVSAITSTPENAEASAIWEHAAERAGTVVCNLDVSGGPTWRFTIVPGAAWARNDLFFATETDFDAGGTRPLDQVEIEGSTSAFASCVDGERGPQCLFNLIVDNSYIQVVTGGDGRTAENAVADLERLLALI